MATVRKDEPASPDGAALSFEDWYAESWARLVAAVTLETRSRQAAEDAVADASARLLMRWDTAPIGDPSGWTYRVAVRSARRSQWRRSKEPVDVGRKETADIYGDPDLWRAVGALPLQQRRAIVLRYLLDLTQAEVARAMGVAPGTVAALLNQGRMRLRSNEGLR